MVTEERCAKDQQAPFEPMRNAGLVVAEEGKSHIEMADFGLGQFRGYRARRAGLCEYQSLVREVSVAAGADMIMATAELNG